MGKITRPQMVIVKFGTEDVIATSGILFYPVYSRSVNELSTGEWFLILNSEGKKSFSDWDEYYYGLDSDALLLKFFSDGDWYTYSGGSVPGGEEIGNQNLPEHTGLTYIWYGSGYGVRNVNFNTQGQPWSYYLNNNIPLPRSN